MLQKAFIAYVAVAIAQVLTEVKSVPSWMRENITFNSDFSTNENLQINSAAVLQRKQTYSLDSRTAGYHKRSINTPCVIPEKGTCDLLAASLVSEAGNSNQKGRLQYYYYNSLMMAPWCRNS
jgi:hypothetical protein